MGWGRAKVGLHDCCAEGTKLQHVPEQLLQPCLLSNITSSADNRLVHTTDESSQIVLCEMHICMAYTHNAGLSNHLLHIEPYVCPDGLPDIHTKINKPTVVTSRLPFSGA